MTICIVGGSNSVMKEGWVARFNELAAPEQVINASIGATTSMMALFQILRRQDLHPGDTVIWEYAVNDGDQCRTGHPLHDLLRSLEHLVRHCQRAGLKLALAVFTPRGDEMAEERGPYFKALLALAAHYDLSVFDVSTEWRLAHGRPHMPAHLYSGPPHYKHLPGLMAMIAKGTLSAARKARVPPPRAPLYTGRTVAVVQEVLDGEAFRNSILSVTLAPVPLARIRFEHEGEFLGFFCLCTQGMQSGLRLTIRRFGLPLRRMRVSTTPRGDAERRLFRAYSVERISGALWPCAPGQVLNVAPIEATGRVFADFTLRPRLTRIGQPHQPVFAGLVLQIPEG